LVEALLSKYSSPGDRVLDPFAGVGTTLFEASRKQLASYGTEINPAAIAMATTVMFVPLSRACAGNEVGL
jgi:DNA modification methylase